MTVGGIGVRAGVRRVASPPVTETNGAAAIVAGWYPDPAGRFELRYHNGGAWTADVSTDGERYVDPQGTRPSVRPVGSGGGRNRLAVAAMVLGITSVSLGWIPFVFALAAVAAVLGIVFGVAGRARAAQSGVGGGFALTGIITGFVGLLVCALGLVFTIAFARAIDAYTDPEPSTAVIDRCTLDGSTAIAAGTITNDGSKRTDYSIRVDFVRAGTNNVARSARVEIDDLDAGATAPFSVTRNVSVDEIDCVIARVDGPLPFGVDVDG